MEHSLKIDSSPPLMLLQSVAYQFGNQEKNPVTSLEIVNLIKDFQGKKQASVVVVTSDLSVAFSMADRLVFLWNGKLIDVGTPAQALNSTYPAVNQFISGKSIGPLTADEYA
ncbi:MAG: hypothetical protein EB120_06040 [Proteobacteria bacterium]|nr:hypothetical protein [Pseudomonadota bacterium]